LAASVSSSQQDPAALSVPQKCPLCGGDVIKGRTAYGCSNWRTGCTWRLPFDASNS
jgi:DNA topoisomerase-3